MAEITEHVRDLAQRYTAAWCSQDPERVAAFFAPEGSLRVNDGPPAIGHDAIAEVARGFMTALPDMEVQMDELLARDGRIIYNWTLTGTNRGPNGTGRRVRISGFEEWKIGGDGLVAQSQGHFDDAEYQRQLQGHVP